VSSAPYFKLYFSDLAGDTLFLSDAELGSYVLLIGAMWNAGGQLPNDPLKLSRIARVQPKAWARRWAAIAQFFDDHGDTISHQRVFAERQKVASTSAERAAAGRASAEAKRLKSLEVAATSVDGLFEQTDQQNPTILNTIATEEANASSSGKPVAKAKAKSRRKPETEIPDGFPDAEAKDDARNRAAADGAELNVAIQAERFRNHAFQNDRRTRDWRAAWRNWIVTALESAPKRGTPAGQPLIDAPRFPNALVREAALSDLRGDESWIVSWLDPCGYRPEDKAILCRSQYVADTLRKGAPSLERRGAKIVVEQAKTKIRSVA
jgi:uncharacterized protein YdaU (DUF1376 family)